MRLACVGRTDPLLHYLPNDLLQPSLVGVHHEVGMESGLEGIGRQKATAEGVNGLDRELVEAAEEYLGSMAKFIRRRRGQRREIDSTRF